MQHNGDEPEADGEFRERIEKRSGNHHERHREGGHDGPDHRVLQIRPERIGVKRKAADEKEEERGGNDCPCNLPPAMKGKCIFQTPAEAGDAESKPGHRGGKTAKP